MYGDGGESDFALYKESKVKPTAGNSACMMALAEGDIVDKFVDATNFKELSDFAEKLRDLMK